MGNTVAKNILYGSNIHPSRSINQIVSMLCFFSLSESQKLNRRFDLHADIVNMN